MWRSVIIAVCAVVLVGTFESSRPSGSSRMS